MYERVIEGAGTAGEKMSKEKLEGNELCFLFYMHIHGTSICTVVHRQTPDRSLASTHGCARSSWIAVHLARSACHEFAASPLPGLGEKKT